MSYKHPFERDGYTPPNIKTLDGSKLVKISIIMKCSYNLLYFMVSGVDGLYRREAVRIKDNLFVYEPHKPHNRIELEGELMTLHLDCGKSVVSMGGIGYDHVSKIIESSNPPGCYTLSAKLVNSASFQAVTYHIMLPQV